ncbi:MAG: peptide-methionine (S)-S-oxide reductase [Glaciecola sp.]|jgi:peptide-methionine (S)-S-oxide reductase|uniref:peptide-methionine (S)-S-oxide reductase MsrA n=1 Tax=Congregibacter sp. TaxID=2744308 RepID=UPI0039E6740D
MSQQATQRSFLQGLTFAQVLTILAALTCMSVNTLAEERTASFAGGCFWCVEVDFQKLDGVIDVVSGFTGGSLQNPTYRGNHEGHYEAAEVTYDSEKISYEELLVNFWRTIDPLDAGGQFCDRGFSYKTAVFVDNEAEGIAAEKSLLEVDALFPNDSVATVILPAGRFWPVEEYHQNYAEKNPLRYKYYRFSCGRDKRVSELWDDKNWGLSDQSLKP